jgi:hypothetical protein
VLAHGLDAQDAVAVVAQRMRTKPPSSPASMLSARPMALKGNWLRVTSVRPSTSTGSRPAATISGSVKQTAAMVTGRRCADARR